MEPGGHQQGGSSLFSVLRVKLETLSPAKPHIPRAPATCCPKRFYSNSVQPTRIFCCQHQSKFFLSNIYKLSPLSLKTPEFCPLRGHNLGCSPNCNPETSHKRFVLGQFCLFANKVQTELSKHWKEMRVAYSVNW